MANPKSARRISVSDSESENCPPPSDTHKGRKVKPSEPPSLVHGDGPERVRKASQKKAEIGDLFFPSLSMVTSNSPY